MFSAILCALHRYALLLQKFTKLNTSIQYLEWQTAYTVGTDGTETELDYTVSPEKGDRFRLETVVPASSEYGNLVFETAGLNMTVSIDGKEVWQSETAVPENAVGQTQAIIPLPQNTECRLTVTGTVTDTASLIFPPLPRFVPVDAQEIESYAYANYYGIPAGATAFISLMIAGLFLLSVTRKKADWSLIPLFLASVGLTMQWITKGMGHHFLSDGLVDFLNRQEIGILLLVLLVVYLVMNRQRKFWKYLGISAIASAAALGVAYTVSFSEKLPFQIYRQVNFGCYGACGLFGAFVLGHRLDGCGVRRYFRLCRNAFDYCTADGKQNAPSAQRIDYEQLSCDGKQSDRQRRHSSRNEA